MPVQKRKRSEAQLAHAKGIAVARWQARDHADPGNSAREAENHPPVPAEGRAQTHEDEGEHVSRIDAVPECRGRKGQHRRFEARLLARTSEADVDGRPQPSVGIDVPW